MSGGRPATATQGPSQRLVRLAAVSRQDEKADHPARPPPQQRHPPDGPQAAAIYWPDIFATPEAEAQKPRLVEQMRAVRPVVETG